LSHRHDQLYIRSTLKWSNSKWKCLCNLSPNRYRSLPLMWARLCNMHTVLISANNCHINSIKHIKF